MLPPEPRFLRRAALVAGGLLALAGLSVVLTSRGDSRTARDLCTAAATARFAAPAGVASVDRVDDDTFLVRGSAGRSPYTCRVVREPLDDHWEVSGVS
ncbi:hypothetical protein [Dactylosporangium sp. CA-139066]|uniref:hypothetical protein n=1 Tax=Dactylosporangium sp. CA-139066 TaxID=3239930 RepID=UPI003D9405AD